VEWRDEWVCGSLQQQDETHEERLAEADDETGRDGRHDDARKNVCEVVSADQ
jgi:hypothetical protein